MSLHGTVQLCAGNKLSFQRSSRPSSAQKISLSVEQSSFTAICLPVWMIITAELAWWPLPCVWLYQEDKFILWKSLESAWESVYIHPPAQTMKNPLSAATSAWGEPKSYGGFFPDMEILRRWTCHCLRHSSKFPSNPHNFFRTRRPLRSGCSCSFSQGSVACPVGHVLHCSCSCRLSWPTK